MATSIMPAFNHLHACTKILLCEVTGSRHWRRVSFLSSHTVTPRATIGSYNLLWLSCMEFPVSMQEMRHYDDAAANNGWHACRIREPRLCAATSQQKQCVHRQGAQASGGGCYSSEKLRETPCAFADPKFSRLLLPSNIQFSTPSKTDRILSRSISTNGKFSTCNPNQIMLAWFWSDNCPTFTRRQEGHGQAKSVHTTQWSGKVSVPLSLWIKTTLELLMRNVMQSGMRFCAFSWRSTR